IGATTVDLRWTDNCSGLAAFDIERSDDSGHDWAPVDSTDTGVTNFSDTTAVAGTFYHYRVIADNGSIVSAPSLALDVLTLPAAPATVTATPISATEIDISWSAAQ